MRKIFAGILMALFLLGLRAQFAFAQTQLQTLQASEQQAIEQLNSFQISINNTTLNTEQRLLNAEESLKKLTATRVELVKYASDPGTTAETYATHQKILTDLNSRYRDLVESSVEKGYDTTGYVFPPSTPSFQTAREPVELENSQRLADAAKDASDSHEQALTNVDSACDTCQKKFKSFGYGLSTLLGSLCCLLQGMLITLAKFSSDLADSLRTILDADAKTLGSILFRDSPNLQLYNYARSFINYALVALLIVGAFSNVLRINLDTYGIKKLLPGLISGFVAANLSIYIARLLIDFAQVLTNTVDELAKQIMGGSNISAVIAEKYPVILEAVIFAGGTIGGILAPFSAGISVGIGIIIGILIAILITFFPLLILLGLYIVFSARFYVIQFLVMIAPLAFITIGLPGQRKWFDSWYKTFMTWVFIQPTAFALMLVAGIIFYTNPANNSFITLVIGSLALISALTIPFKAGGIITATIDRYGRRGLSLGGVAAGGTSGWLGKKALEGAGAAQKRGNSVIATGLGALGTGLSGLPKIKTAIQGRYEERAKKEEARQTAAAYATLKDTRKEDALFDAEVAEEEKKIDDNASVDELLDKLKEAKTEQQHVAIQNKIQKSKNSHKVYRSLLSDTAHMSKYDTSLYERDAAGNIKNSARNRDLLKVQMAGGYVAAAGDTDPATGTMFTPDRDRVIVTSSRHHKRARSRQQNIAKANGFAHEAVTSDKEGNIQSAPKLNTDAAGQMTGGDALSTAAKPNYDDWVERDARSTPLGFSEAFLQAAATGAYNPMIDNGNALKNLSGYAISELARVPRADLDAQLTGVAALNTTARGATRTRREALLDQIDRSRS